MTSNPGLYFKTEDDTIIIFNDDFLKLDLIKAGSIDLIVTSPPYNVDIPYHSTKDDGPYINYLKFSELWLNKALSLVKSDGRMCLNIPLDKNRGGQESVYADLVTIAKSIGWKYHSTIIWNEGNISRRTAWGSFQNARAPYVIAPVEAIVVFYKIEWKKREKGHSDISRDEFITWTNALWSFSGENRKKLGHPSPYPLELPVRCLKLFSYRGDTVLDPFLGSGTTLLACQLLQRRGIGVDIDKEYCRIAKNRLSLNQW